MLKYRLMDLTTYKDPTDDRWYMKAVYEEETDIDICSFTIPKIAIPINQYGVYIGTDAHSHTVDIGFGEVPVLRTDVGMYKNVYYVHELIKKKTKEMTLDEIEEALGHKVKIVTKEDKS